MHLKRSFKERLVGLSCVLVCSACSSSGQNVVAEEQADKVVINKVELAQLKQAATQWQNTPAEGEDLHRLENKLTRLSTALKKIKQQNQPQESIFDSNTKLSRDSLLFSLQVAAFQTQDTLYALLAQLKRQVPDIINDTTIVNIEPTVHHNTTYYRLKLGAYKSKAEAQSDCMALMQQQIDCFVSNYITSLNQSD